jgi:hypothetical protein
MGVSIDDFIHYGEHFVACVGTEQSYTRLLEVEETLEDR